MITKFEKFNEGIKSLLVGPSEEEVWNALKDKTIEIKLRKFSEIGFLKGVKYCIEHGADIEYGYNKSLRTAAEHGHLDIVKYLVEHGADIHARNDYAIRMSKLNTDTGVYDYLEEQVKKEKTKGWFKKIFKFNESIKSLLVGPSEEEVWKSFGYDRIFTPEEYFIYLTDGIEIISPNGLYYEWKKENKIVFEQYLNPEKLIFIKYSNNFKIYELIFNMSFGEFCKFMIKMFNKYFKDKIDIYHYQFRIEYNK